MINQPAATHLPSADRAEDSTTTHDAVALKATIEPEGLQSESEIPQEGSQGSTSAPPAAESNNESDTVHTSTLFPNGVGALFPTMGDERAQFFPYDSPMFSHAVDIDARSPTIGDESAPFSFYDYHISSNAVDADAFSLAMGDEEALLPLYDYPIPSNTMDISSFSPTMGDEGVQLFYSDSTMPSYALDHEGDQVRRLFTSHNA